LEKEKEKAPARTTPTMDLFGKSRREASMEVEKELKDIEDRKAMEERMKERRLGKKPTADDRKSPGLGRLGSDDRKSPGLARFGSDDRKSPGLRRQGTGDRKSPTDASGRKTPTGGVGGESAVLMLLGTLGLSLNS
jgi:hypothetical protein